MINIETATREELIAYYIESQKVTNKKSNKTAKLLADLQQLFNKYSDNSTDTLFWLHYCLSALFSNIQIPINEELDKLDYVPEEEDLRKLNNMQVKVASKKEDLKLRKSKKNNVTTVTEVEEDREVSTPL